MATSPLFVPAIPTPGGVPAISGRDTPPGGGIFGKWGRRPIVELVLWQNRLRVAFATVIGGIAALLRALEIVSGTPGAVLLPTIGYIVFVAAAGVVIAWRQRAPTALVALLILADISVIFVVTALAAPPALYSRALLLGFLVLVFAEFHFGHAATTVAIAGTVVAFLALMRHAAAQGAPVVWAAELWHLAVWLTIAVSFAVLYGSFSRRLARLVELFQRAQEGDFTQAYDERADARPDAITMVGRAYNEFRSQLATMVLTDILSGCFNRRGYQQHMQRALARASRTAEPVSLLLIDIDWFKSVNDTFGHLAGDGVIRELGALLREGRRGYDVCARIGGEEFALLLPGTGAEHAMAIARRLRDAVGRRPFGSIGSARGVTVSIGVATTVVRDPGIAEDLHGRADEALYEAKRSGRNRVVLWPGGAEATDVGEVRIAGGRVPVADRRDPDSGDYPRPVSRRPNTGEIPTSGRGD